MPVFGPPHHRQDREERQAETTADVQERSRGTTATGMNPTLSEAIVAIRHSRMPFLTRRVGVRTSDRVRPDGAASCHRARRGWGRGPLHGPRRLHEPALADRLRFLRAFAANPRQVGAILPTSRLRRPGHARPRRRARCAASSSSSGAGTGVQTGEILARMASGRPAGRAGDRPRAGPAARGAVRRPAAAGRLRLRREPGRSTWTASRPTSWSAPCRSRRWSRACGAASWTRCRRRWRRAAWRWSSSTRR